MPHEMIRMDMIRKQIWKQDFSPEEGKTNFYFILFKFSTDTPLYCLLMESQRDTAVEKTEHKAVDLSTAIGITK